MIEPSALEKGLRYKGDSEGDDYCMVFSLCDEDYLV